MSDRYDEEQVDHGEWLSDAELELLRRERQVREIVDHFVPGIVLRDGAMFRPDDVDELHSYFLDEGYDEVEVAEALRRAQWLWARWSVDSD